MSDRRPKILELVGHALHDAMFDGHIKKSFKISGIYPFSLVEMLKFDRITDDLKKIDDDPLAE